MDRHRGHNLRDDSARVCCFEFGEDKAVQGMITRLITAASTSSATSDPYCIGLQGFVINYPVLQWAILRSYGQPELALAYIGIGC